MVGQPTFCNNASSSYIFCRKEMFNRVGKWHEMKIFIGEFKVCTLYYLFSAAFILKLNWGNLKSWFFTKIKNAGPTIKQPAWESSVPIKVNGIKPSKSKSKWLKVRTTKIQQQNKFKIDKNIDSLQESVRYDPLS